MAKWIYLVAALPALLCAQPGRGPRPWWDSNVARDLNLTDAQNAQIRSTVQEYRGRMSDLREAVNTAEKSVEAAFNEELRSALSAGFSAGEIEAGKKGLLQSRKLTRSNDENLAAGLASHLILGRTFSWDEELERKIAALTPQAVLDALRRYVDPAKLSVFMAGDFSKLAAK